MSEDWLHRWNEGRTGWHEEEGNAALKQYWPSLAPGARVLVPLCGKARDLVWLAHQGYAVCGVELSSRAIELFFSENGIDHDIVSHASIVEYRAQDMNLSLFCGDYFEFLSPPFDALYDRGALVALPEAMRGAYVAHTRKLLADNAYQLLITLEYDQSVVAGPPYAIMPGDVHRLWPNLRRVYEQEDIDNSPPKFRAAGLESMSEVVWTSA